MYQPSAGHPSAIIVSQLERRAAPEHCAGAHDQFAQAPLTNARRGRPARAEHSGPIAMALADETRVSRRVTVNNEGGNEAGFGVPNMRSWKSWRAWSLGGSAHRESQSPPNAEAVPRPTSGGRVCSSETGGFGGPRILGLPSSTSVGPPSRRKSE
ncbi:hypothetical protein ACJZ2D_003630 [Fusarium nematophilum]